MTFTVGGSQVAEVQNSVFTPGSGVELLWSQSLHAVVVQLENPRDSEANRPQA